MSLQITGEIEGAVELSRELGIAADKLHDFRPPLLKIASEMSKAHQMNFDSRGSLYGGWAPRKKDQPWPLLEKTGTLRKGYQSDLQGLDTLIIGNPVPYFKYHQRGTSRLPRRIMLKIDQARKTFIVRAFQSFIIGSLRGK